MKQSTRTQTPISMRLETDWLAAFDAWRAEQPFPPSRVAAIRAGVDMLMRAHSKPVTTQEPSAAPKPRGKVSPVTDVALPPGKRQCADCGEIFPRIALHACKAKSVAK